MSAGVPGGDEAAGRELARRKLEAEGARGPESDPKGAAGRAKARFSNLSPAALVLLGEVMRQGGQKYGDYNWSEERMRAGTYFEATLRHLLQWWTGEECDAESGVDHLAHVMACAMILLEQRLSGRLIDDRPKSLLPFDEAAEAVREARAAFDARRAAAFPPAGTELELKPGEAQPWVLHFYMRDGLSFSCRRSRPRVDRRCNLDRRQIPCPRVGGRRLLHRRSGSDRRRS